MEIRVRRSVIAVSTLIAASCWAVPSSMARWLLPLAGAMAIVVISRRTIIDARCRANGWAGWVLSAVSLTALAVRDLARTLAGPTDPMAIVPAVMAGGAAVAALALLSPSGISVSQRIRETVEGLLISGAFVIVAWVSLIGDTIITSPLPPWSRVAVFAGPAGIAWVAASSALVLLRTPRANRSSLGWFTTGTALVLLAEAFTARAAIGMPSTAPAGWVTAVGAFAYGAFAIGATHATTLPSPRLVDTSLGQRLGWTMFIVPSSLALALAIPRLRPGVSDPALLGIAAVVIAVHLVHQTLTVIENRHLIADLDERVEERTQELAQRELYYRSLFEHSSDIVAVVGDDLRFRDHTPSLKSVLGWSPDDLHGLRADDLFIGLGAHDALSAYRRVFADGSPAEIVHDRLLHTDGTWRDVEMHLANHLDDPSVRGIVITTRDITQRRRLEDELLHHAFHDPLTGLANRALLRSTVERSMEIASVKGHRVSLLLLDLDGFKGVNDTFGHPAGDRLLVTFARRVAAVMRVEDTFARLGGDEFAVLVERGTEPADVAACILGQLHEPFDIEGTQVHLSASIGIADTALSATVDDLLRNADVAMYEAKRLGRRAAVHFEQTMHDRSVHRLQTLTDLRRAIHDDELAVWLQPIVDLRSGGVIGHEALVRWCHPVKGIIPPGDFIALAEESGLIEPIGELVLRRSLAALHEHRSAHGGNLFISVNISARQFDNPNLAAIVESALHERSTAPEHLTIEITESTVMRNPEAARDQLDRLVALGVRIALDDFGTGYSSLAALSQFPLSVLKVDRSFVASLGDDPASASALLAAIEEIGRALGLRLVAEGVETREECQALLDLGFAFGQGYLFARPMPADVALAALLAHDGATVGA